jgi:hypothetical protein
MNTLLLGKAEEIDLLRPEIRAMVDNEGVYVCGDTDRPEYTVPIISIAGVLYSVKLDEPLDPERFKETVTVAGSFHKPPNARGKRRKDRGAGFASA